MTYNLHPIFVHFPIALLVVYSIIRIVPLRRWLPAVAWRDIERLLLVVGVLGAFAGLSTGETAEHLVRPSRQLVEAHSFFASFATWVYGALLAGEVVIVLNTKHFVWIESKCWLAALLRLIERILGNYTFGTVLALVGLVAISITGMLGGIISYGVSADPIAPFLLRVLGITV